MDTVPLQRPALFVGFTPSTGIPSFHQDSVAGGLLELESQIKVAWLPGRKSIGSLRILIISGGTVGKEVDRNSVFIFLIYFPYISWFTLQLQHCCKQIAKWKWFYTHNEHREFSFQRRGSPLHCSALHICILLGYRSHSLGLLFLLILNLLRFL